MDQGKVTKEICLTLDQWEKMKDALDFYERAAVEFLSFTGRTDFREKYIQPVYAQMPDEVF